MKLRAFHNGKRYIRFECKKLTIRIVKRDNPVTDQKILIPGI